MQPFKIKPIAIMFVLTMTSIITFTLPVIIILSKVQDKLDTIIKNTSKPAEAEPAQHTVEYSKNNKTPIIKTSYDLSNLKPNESFSVINYSPDKLLVYEFCKDSLFETEKKYMFVMPYQRLAEIKLDATIWYCNIYTLDWEF